MTTLCDYDIVIYESGDAYKITETCLKEATYFYNAVKGQDQRVPIARCDQHEVIVEATILYKLTEEQYVVQKVLGE